MKKIIIILFILSLCGCGKIDDVSSSIDPDKPVVALTFDDGPSKYTNEIIDYLYYNGVKATFFIVGENIETYEDVLQDMLNYGNEIGNHSYSHEWLTKLNKKQLDFQVNQVNKLLDMKFNYTPKYLRPPYGDVNNRLRNLDFDIVLWNIDSRDWKLKNSKSIAKKVLNNNLDGKIVLMHDIYERSYYALKIIIPELKRQGYQFVTISEFRKYQALKEFLNDQRRN